MGAGLVDGGKIAGAKLTWTMDVKQPVAIKLSFDVTIEGDVMKGHAKLGLFGKADLNGKRL